MRNEEAVVQKSFLCYLAHPILSFLGDLKWTGWAPGCLLLGWGFAGKPAWGLLLRGGGDEPSSLALAVCWHLPPARGATLKCEEMQGLRSLLNSRKAASWAELKVERHERSVASAVNLKQCHSLPDPKGRGLWGKALAQVFSRLFSMTWKMCWVL